MFVENCYYYGDVIGGCFYGISTVVDLSLVRDEYRRVVLLNFKMESCSFSRIVFGDVEIFV